MIKAMKEAISADAGSGGNGVTFTIYAIGGNKTANDLQQDIWSSVEQYAANAYSLVSVSPDTSFLRDEPTVHLRITIGPSTGD